MNELSNQLTILIGFLFLDISGIFSMTKPINFSRGMLVKIKSIFTRKISLITLIFEILAITTLILSFFYPWYYLHLLDMNRGETVRYIFIPMDSYFSGYFLYFLKLAIKYAYFITLIILFIKIASNTKFNIFHAFTFIKIIIFSLGFLFLLNIDLGCPPMMIPEVSCIDSGFTSGFYLCMIGLITLLLNGVFLSVYSHFRN